MEGFTNHNSRSQFKNITLCPFEKKKCVTDSTVCGYLGYYKDCPVMIG